MWDMAELRLFFYAFNFYIRVYELYTYTDKSIRKMKFNINSDILNKTDKCSENYSCLNGKEECFCEVKEHFGNKIIFVKPINVSCNYSLSFGYSFVCNCPTRKEIYNLYKT